ncbi:type I DNA topoisomerase [Chloroflexota bacterium]
MAKKLVIVESPAKAKTIGQFLGSKYIVKASVGHVRDLPKSKLGVDVNNDFEPQYLIPREKRKVINELKKAVKDASSLYLATDPDREGEAISWHLVQAMAPDKKTSVQRVVFHEITKEAVAKAFEHPREIDMNLVNAQQARRVLDRLVGYKLSPLLWKKVRRGLSAGRVQSAVLKMIVDREREIQGFNPIEYWVMEAELSKATSLKSKQRQFRASLIGYARKVKTKLAISNEHDANKITKELETASYRVADVKHKETRRQPAAPFITSTLQQEAWRKLKFDSKRTMSIAQQLYEGLAIGDVGTVGLITYMRTDSTRVSASATADARSYITKKYGSHFVPKSVRVFSSKAKGAQEAHEAIRPSSIFREPDSIKIYLSRDQYKLYQLIWKRMGASQMAAAIIGTDTVEIHAKPAGSDTAYLFRSTDAQVKFTGFLALYRESKDELDEDELKKPPLPGLSKDEALKLIKLYPEQRFTQPPPRYTEATIVKALEENGVGRPSTYAPILSIIQSRGYGYRVKGNFIPEEIGLLVNDLLNEHFADIVNLGFTAHIENELDEIANAQQQWVPIIKEFYETFDKDLKKADAAIEKVKIEDKPTDEVCDKCGSPMVIKRGRYGDFIACSAFPNCKNTKSVLQTTGAKCPQCSDGEIVERRSKKGKKFYGCSTFPKCDYTSIRKPTASKSEVAK